MKRFLVRIIVNILGIYLSVLILYGVKPNHSWGVLAVAGLILAIVNIIIKPILVILTLPAVVLSMGLFLIIINGFLIWLTHVIYPHFEIDSFGAAVLAGIIISLLNYIVTKTIDERSEGAHA